MIRNKFVINLIVLCSLFISLIASAVPAFAVEPIDPADPNIHEETGCCTVEAITNDDNLDVPENDSDIIITSDAITQFVERLYDLVLQRPSDPAGLLDWTTELRSRRVTGAHVAHGFFFSREMINRNLSNDRYVEILYLTLLNRASDPGGRATWVGRLNEGYTREYVFSGFVNSIEFDGLCRDAGITRGTYTPPPGSAIRAFVTRLYRTTLAREPDIGGLNNWTNSLLSGTTGAHVAQGFVFSREMINENLPNDRFVERLYESLLGRASDPGGRATWVGRLDEGLPREDVFAGFVNSREFDGLCRDAGIIRGTYTPPPGGMVRVFITNIYRAVLGRVPNATEMEFWFTALRNGSATGASMAYELIFSPDNIGRSLTDNAFVDALFLAMIGREISAAERTFWVNELRAGFSRYSVYVKFVNFPEFEKLCREHGITRGVAPQPTNSIPGSTMVSKVWNLIIAAHFNGISDRPEHVAGIVGNLQSEAGIGLCPFQIQVSNHVGLGLMQWSFGRRIAIETYMWNNGISREQFMEEMNKHLTWYCSNPQTVHPHDFLDSVLEVQINFMFHEFRTTSERLYLNYVDFPEDRHGIAGARAYAELFCSLALRPGPGTGEINDIRDEGVIRALTASPYVGGAGRLDRISYSALETRRNRAEAVYRTYLINHR